MVKEIADHFQRSPVTIGEVIMKVEDLLKRDKSFEKVLKRMEENLVKGRKRKYRVSIYPETCSDSLPTQILLANSLVRMPYSLSHR